MLRDQCRIDGLSMHVYSKAGDALLDVVEESGSIVAHIGWIVEMISVKLLESGQKDNTMMRMIGP